MQGTKNRSTYLQQPPRPRGLCSNAEKPDAAFLKKKYIRPPALRRKRIWDLLLAGIGSRTRKRPLPPVLALLCEGISSEFGKRDGGLGRPSLSPTPSLTLKQFPFERRLHQQHSPVGERDGRRFKPNGGYQ